MCLCMNTPKVSMLTIAFYFSFSKSPCTAWTIPTLTVFFCKEGFPHFGMLRNVCILLLRISKIHPTLFDDLWASSLHMWVGGEAYMSVGPSHCWWHCKCIVYTVKCAQCVLFQHLNVRHFFVAAATCSMSCVYFGYGFNTISVRLQVSPINKS